MAKTSVDEFFDLHRSQLEVLSVPQHFWLTIYEKLQTETFDAGETFSLLRLDYEPKERAEYAPAWELQVKTEKGIDASDPKQVYLVDHAWTFQIEKARKDLGQTDLLRERMASIIGISSNGEADVVAEEIFNKMWKYCDCYWTLNLENVEQRTAIWYIMDEVGTAIQHDDTPNFKVVPFMHIPEQLVYSLVFPIMNLNCGDIVTRDCVTQPTQDHKDRAAMVLPWINTSFLKFSFNHRIPDTDYFLSGHIQESLPILEYLTVNQPRKEKYKVFAEYILVHRYLTDDLFEIVDDAEEADILWLTHHFKNFKELSERPHKFVNQFPFEYVLTIKDLLCIICRRKADENCDLLKAASPAWLPITYNLKTELPQFISYFQHRQKLSLDNYWIIKPFNLARGLDTHITNNVNFIVRLPITGPKIAQKYIENPVLFHRPECLGKVKFDLRYVLLVKSFKPMEAYVYKNFFLRFANTPFAMCDFGDYTKHFTVMNYIDDAQNLKHMLCEDFKTQWNQQYPGNAWDEVEEKILLMFREVLECANMESPPLGVAESPQSRSLYAADIMLEWLDNTEMQPKLLEINWTPDCTRACEYYPDFYNDIFKLLFCDIVNSNIFYEI